MANSLRFPYSSGITPLATAHTYPSSACHCEPVRTLVWQSASPQKCLASWQLFGQIRYALRICPKYCFSLCATARRTDCHVAPLLAMTCNNLLRVRTARTHCRGKPVTAHEFAQSAAFSELSLRGSGLPRRFAPRNDMQKFAACMRLPGGTAGQIHRPLRIRLKYCLFLPFSAGKRIATSLRSSQ